MEKKYTVSINPHQDNSELNVLFAGQHTTDPSYKVGPKTVGYYLLHFVVSGKGIFRFGNREYKLEQGQVFLIYPGKSFTYESDPHDPWYYRWIGFRGSYADILCSKLSFSPNNPVIVPPSPCETEQTFARIQSILNAGLNGCALEASGLMRMLLGCWLNHAAIKQVKASDAPYVDKAIRFLSQHYDQPITIYQLSRSLGYHRTYFSRVFRERTGLSPSAYLHKIRMEQAKLLLTQPLTIKQVASSVGYSDALFFSNQFKKWSGYSPSEYRLMNASE
ncbi:Arabinose operon regulatory protein [Paenibacillus solanacearum]|uniref:Arabinose operon regulatory protein n=1 Tax=Paenibacillus solanacearum TaxID=2048548 RepID=A0A916NNM8_9BACL|nr:AraC family transcriptional regulator [Paenibacillus solanacearum]CAG7608898.1 Arabinose operon regulatory protein [Paenibacillus solanacearum]